MQLVEKHFIQLTVDSLPEERSRWVDSLPEERSRWVDSDLYLEGRGLE